MPVLDQKIQELEDSKAAMINILEDLTVAKNEIEAAKAYDDALLASIADGVVAADREGRITTVNEALAKMFDLPPVEFIGKEIKDALVFCREDGTRIPPEERPFYKAVQATSYTVFSNRDNYYQRHDGSLFPAAIDTAPIMEEGKSVGAIAVIRDITREKEIDRAKTEFISLASHQLRTPLTAVGWYSELLGAPDTTPAEQQEYIKEIRGANRRMVDLVDALLNVSRIELSTFIVDPKLIDIIPLIKDSIGEIQSFLTKKSLHLTETYDAPSMTLSADTTLMRMMVSNLISNAAKYTPANGTIEVKVTVKDGKWQISVADTGVGIPAKDQPDIFKRMFRTDEGRLLDPDGTGLGLYLVKSITEASGGQVSFVSEHGKGTTFTLTYPAQGMKARAGSRRLRPTAPIHSL